MARARDEGLSGVTHLYNAMEPLAGRAPGVIGQALAGLYAGIIADGIHVHEGNLALAARCLPDRLCLVTDAMLTLGTDIDAFEIDGRPMRREGGRLVGPDGQLAGAHLAMDEAVARLAGWLREGKLTAGHARALVTASNAVDLARKVIERNLSVRETEELVALMFSVLERLCQTLLEAL